MFLWVGVKFARGDKNARVYKIARRQKCTTPILHEGTKLHEDKIALRVIFARTHFCTRGHFCTSDNFAESCLIYVGIKYNFYLN